MFKKSILALITIMVIFPMTSCGPGKQTSSGSETVNPQESSSGRVTETVAPDHEMLPYISGSVASLKLDAGADGSTQHLIVGQVISISLESNPSTGYRWFAMSSDPAILVQMGEPEIQESTASATPIAGAPGTAILFFQAVKAGSVSISLEYKRGWEKDVTPEKTITISVEVK